MSKRRPIFADRSAACRRAIAEIPDIPSLRGVEIDEPLRTPATAAQDREISILADQAPHVLLAGAQPVRDVRHLEQAGQAHRDVEGIEVVGELNGRADTRSGAAPVGTESRATMRVGGRITRGTVRLDAGILLGVSRDATGYEVRRAFVELRRAFEPSRILTPRILDLADDVRKIVVVLEEAYEILRDAARRERYRRAIDARPE